MSQRLRINRLGDIVGADSGNEDENDNDTDEELDDQDEDFDDDDSDGDEEEEETVESLKEKLATAELERERAHRRMRRADRAKSKADNELRALREGGAKELAEAQDKVKDLEAKLAKASGSDPQSAIREEFRDSTDVTWHNPRVAFALLNLDEVDVDDSGKVDAASLKDAIETLAKEHPYLVKTEKSDKSADDDSDDTQDENPKPRRPSGHRSSSNRQTRETKRKQNIAAKYGIRDRI